MSHDGYYNNIYTKGNEAAGGGSGYPPASLRICPGAQGQPQLDPKQQQQQPVQGIPMGYTAQPRTPVFPRPPRLSGAPRPLLGQQITNANIQYPAPMLIPSYGPQAVILPQGLPANGRHQQTHGGGQGAGTGGAPGHQFFSQQQLYSLSPHPMTTYQFNPYVYQMRNTQGYPAQNPGPHPGTPATQPPPHQPQQPFVVDGGVRGGGGGGGAGGGAGQGGGGVILQPMHQPQQSANVPVRRRRSNAIPIVHPTSGKDITDDLYSENNSGESTAPPTPHSYPQDREYQEVAAEFAAKVAAAAVAPSEAPVMQPSTQALLPMNGPSSSSPPPAAPLTTSPPTDLHPSPATTHTPTVPHSSAVVHPPAILHTPVAAHSPSAPLSVPIAAPVMPTTPLLPVQQPPTQVPTQPSPPQQSLSHQPHAHAQPTQSIPTVSAKTDSPSVDLQPRPKGPTHSPARKPTPVPSSAPPVLDHKKKDKKVAIIGNILPPHREEPEEVRKSSFADEFNIKNLQPVPPAPAPQSVPVQQPVLMLATSEVETNGEPEISIPPSPTAPVSTQPPSKHHDKDQQQSSHHERGKSGKKGGKNKKSGAMKEQSRRWQEKEGGSEMDAFMGSASSPPPTLAAESAPPLSSVPESAVPPQPTPVPECQASSQPPPSLASPTPQPLQVPSNKNLQCEQDEVEEMDQEEEVDMESMIVAVKNEENAKVSASETSEDHEPLTVSDETHSQTPVIERAITLKYTYKEGMWSPLNPEGKKVYDREFLLILRSEGLSTKRPDITDSDIIKSDTTNNNSISANNNNNRRPLHGSSSMNMNRDGFAPTFMRSSSSQRGGGMVGKRGSQQGGRSIRDGRVKGFSSQYKDAVDSELHWAPKGWKPERCKTPPKASEEELKTENLYKRVRGILNKLTPQKFDTLMEQILALPIDTIERLTGVVGLVIDKAVDEPSFSRAYAKLCQNLNKIAIKNSEGEGSNQTAADVSFRKILLTKCQYMFEKKKREEKEGEEGKKSEEERIADLQQQIAEETDKEKKKELMLALEEEERKIRVKYVGLARFIGELFKLNMLTSKIMFGCISTLLEKIEEESLECLCKLLTTVGKDLEAQAKNYPGQSKDLEECFSKMRKLSQKSANSKVSSRVRFMLQDVIELRGNKWVPRREDNNPKTMDQIQRDAERETMMESAALLQASNTPRSKHSDRNDDRRRGGPRGANVQDSEGWISNNKFRNYTFEASKLQHLKGTDSEPASQNLGSYGQFKQWHSGSTGSKMQNSSDVRRGGAFDYPNQNKFAILSDDKKIPPMSRKGTTPSSSLERERAVQGVKDVLTLDRSKSNQNSNPPSRDSSRARGASKPTSVAPQTHVAAEPEPSPPVPEPREPEDEEVIVKKSWVLFEEWLANHNVEESVESVCEAFPQPLSFVRAVMNKVIEEKEIQRVAFGEILVPLLSRKLVSATEVARVLGELIEMGEDLLLDIPLIWKYLGEIIVPIITKNVFTFGDLKLACENVKTNHLTSTLAEIISKLLKEKGPVFIKTQWEESKVKFTDFIPESEVERFIEQNNFGFVIGMGEVEAKDPVLSMIEVEKILCEFLSQDGDKVFDHVCEWVKANVGNKSQDADFIQALMRAVVKVSIKNGKIVQATLIKHSTLIKKFVDTDETRELACLTGIMKLFVNDHENHNRPIGLLVEIFQMLNDNNIISYEAFIKWKTHGNEQGKGVALTSLSSFFVSLSEQDETDEEST